MKTTSAAYKAAQKSNSTYHVRKIELYRRLANGTGWEVSPIYVTSEVSYLDRLSYKLDSDALNEFKVSNIRIDVNNSSRLWDPTSTRFTGFLRFRSRIRIHLGLRVGGVDETFPMFTGLLEDVQEDSNTPTLQLQVISPDFFLQDGNAEKAGVLHTNILLGIGDGITSIFKTPEAGVGVMKEVRVATVVQRAGLRYSVSTLDDIAQQASVTFNAVQPAIGQEVRADYITWKIDQRVEQVVTDVLAVVPQVSIAVIEPVSFTPPAQRELLHTTIGDFSTYYNANIKVIAEPDPPTGDGLQTINAFDSAARWNSIFSLTGASTTRIAGSLSAKWTNQYEADFPANTEYLTVEGDASLPWFETSGATITKVIAGSIEDVTRTAGVDYNLIGDRGNVLVGPAPLPPHTGYLRFKCPTYGGSFFFGLRARLSFSQYADVQLEFYSATRVQIRVGGTVVATNIAWDRMAYHTYRLDAIPNATTTSINYAFYIDNVLQGSGISTDLTLTLLGTVQFRQTGAGANWQLDYLRTNNTTGAVGPALANAIIKTDYGEQLSGLVSFSLITTLGPFFAQIVGTPGNFRYFYSWSTNDVSYTAETEILNAANVGAWIVANAPRFVKFRLQLTAEGETATQQSVTKLFLPGITTSPLLDGGSGIVSWDTWNATIIPNNGSVQRFTASRYEVTMQITFHRAIGVGDTIQSDNFQVTSGFGMPERVMLISLFNCSGLIPPQLTESIIRLTTSTVLISMATLTAKTVADVVADLAKIPDYEIGTDGLGAFFFRNKTIGLTSLYTFDESNIKRVLSSSPGWDRVYNSIRSVFGDYTAIADSTTEGDAVPTSEARHGTKQLSVSAGTLLFQRDVDLATVRAKRYWNRYKEPKRRVTIVVRYMPELDLGDRVTYNLLTPRQVVQPFDARLLGIAHNLIDFETELDLLEV